MMGFLQAFYLHASAIALYPSMGIFMVLYKFQSNEHFESFASRILNLINLWQEFVFQPPDKFNCSALSIATKFSFLVCLQH